MDNKNEFNSKLGELKSKINSTPSNLNNRNFDFDSKKLGEILKKQFYRIDRLMKLEKIWKKINN